MDDRTPEDPVLEPTLEHALEIEVPLPPKKRHTYRRLLANPGFRRLWISQFVSGIGDWLVIGFLIPLVTSLSGGSSFAVAGILIAKIIPALFLSSVTGVIVDRFDRRKLMMTMDLARAVLALFLVTTNNLAVIYLVVLLMETASLFFIPAKNALIPYLVDDKDLTEANGLSYTTQQASMLIGLTASAAILAGFEGIVRLVVDANFIGVSRLVGLFAPALLGPRAGVILDSFTFLISAFTIWGIKIAAKPAASEATHFDLTLVGKDVRESFVFLRDHKELRGLLTTIFLALLGGGALVTVGLEYIRKTLTQAAIVAGSLLERIEALRALVGAPQTFILVFLALGMIGGAILVPRLAHRLRLQLLFAGSVAAFGAGMFFMSLSSKYWQFAIFAIIAGACIAGVTVSGNTYVVCTTEDEIRGRVFTALESVIRVGLLLSMVVVAPISGVIGEAVNSIAVMLDIPLLGVRLLPSRITLWLASAIVIGAAIYAFRTLEWREPGEDAADA